MEDLDFVFHPRSVAVVGSLRDINSPAVRYLRQHKDFGFSGKLYAVSRKATEHIAGVCPCYANLKDIPEPVDYVISCIPASALQELVGDCAAKRVKLIHIYTGRLSETCDPGLRNLEREIVQRARAAGIRVIGPNCMGIYCPESRMTFRFEFPRESGPVAFLSQSAGNTGHLVSLGAGRGLRFSKIISYGNSADLNESDFLEYLTADPQTKVIAMYIEGVKDGRRFLKVLIKAAAAKPVVVMKGGRFGAGARAAASHTASLAGSQVGWDVALRQAGAIRVGSLEEMADVLLILTFLKAPRGRKAAILCGGGGDTVSSADQCEAAGLEVPPLPREVREEVRKMIPEYCSTINNPVDYSSIGDQVAFDKTCEQLVSHPDVDVVICDTQVAWRLGFHTGLDRIRSMVDIFIKIGKASGKPLVVVIHLPDSVSAATWTNLIEQQTRCCQAGIPVYPSLERAIAALARFIHYREGSPEVKNGEMHVNTNTVRDRSERVAAQVGDRCC